MKGLAIWLEFEMGKAAAMENLPRVYRFPNQEDKDFEKAFFAGWDMITTERNRN